MKIKNTLCAAAETPQSPTPANRAIKPGMVKVRAGNQAVSVDGVTIAAGKEGEVPEKRLASLGGLVTKVGCVLLGLLLLGSSVQAQQYSPGQNQVAQTNGSSLRLNGGTNNIAAATTNTYNSIIGLTRYDQVAVQPVFKLVGAGTSAVVFKFSQSVDGTNFVADTSRTISVTAAGTTVVSGISNQNVNAVGYLRLDTIENPNASALTNLLLLAVPKPSRYGN